jgi:hypothetical protein
MLQNRVDPFGDLIFTPARGHWLGNRGIIHNDDRQIVRKFKLKAWITCVLEFKGRRRQVMAPHRYTELFFLDEATAFAAGHRPCFECRRVDALKFKTLWLKGNPAHGLNEKSPIQQLDDVLHRERIDRKGGKLSFEAEPKDLPNGSFITTNGRPSLVFDGQFFPWSPFGYEAGMPLPKTGKVTVLTPRSIVNAFHAGYLPQVSLDAANFRTS